ncbi:MAG: hypothetical protein UW42_C0004G0032 [Candidatus Collierbacteria bacterium GW2011_GWB1_44_197]|nr:MAG: hypothetical protein UW42_C0004G0032 [Candidatus Collierbacteria bacterium GW2011_GWB1_44_197]KKT61849.1 MAG: hypothetical protein UW56_C0017G0032 [Candidatus Collierbacteria bacterium GW2011_GWD1_44_27]
MSFIRAHEAATIASPTTAAVMRFLAVSVLPLSPPEVSHSIPPMTRKAKVRIPATMKATEMTLLIRTPMSVIFIPVGWGTPMVPPAASAWDIRDIFFLVFNNFYSYL